MAHPLQSMGSLGRQTSVAAARVPERKLSSCGAGDSAPLEARDLLRPGIEPVFPWYWQVDF